MEFNVKESTKNKLVLDIKGEDHTLCNILVKRLQKNAHVKIAAYRIDHPLDRIPTLYLETAGSTTPQQALLEAVKDIEDEAKSFDKSFAKQL